MNNSASRAGPELSVPILIGQTWYRVLTRGGYLSALRDVTD